MRILPWSNHEISITRFGSLLTVCLLFATTHGDAFSEDAISFRKDIAPLLVQRCLGCHDNRKSEGRYALHTFEMLLKPGDSGVDPVVSHKPDESYLLEKIAETDESLRMPQEDEALSEGEIDLVRRWIREGARFDGPARTDRLRSILPPRQHPVPPESYRVAVPVFALEFTPDGKQILASGYHEILVRDAQTGKLLNRIQNLPQRVAAIRFHPTRRLAAVVGGAPADYGEIRTIEFDQNWQAVPESMRTLAVWEDTVLDAAFSSDGQTVVAVGCDNSIRAYDLDGGRELWKTRQHADWVTAVGVTDYRFAETLVSNDPTPEGFELSQFEKQGGKHSQQLWLFDNGDSITREANWEVSLRSTNPTDKDLIARVDELTRITTTGIGKTYKVVREPIAAANYIDHEDVIQYLAELHRTWSPTADASAFVVTSSRDRTAKAFRLTNGRLFTTYKGHRREYGALKGLHRVFAVQPESSSRRVWTVGEGQHFHGWNPITVRDEDGTAADMEARFSKAYSVDHLRHDFGGPVFAMSASNDSLVAVSADGGVKEFRINGAEVTFDLNKTASSRAFAGQEDHQFAIASSADGKLIAAAGFTGRLTVWNRVTGEPVFSGTAAPVQAGKR